MMDAFVESAPDRGATKRDSLSDIAAYRSGFSFRLPMPFVRVRVGSNHWWKGGYQELWLRLGFGADLPEAVCLAPGHFPVTPLRASTSLA